ncbi:MAG TPA: hypothetical protein VM165_24515 [Planctomycetaceae bacterium]|nr:hypothetical protein [Planctomycetaceae bacterium]
MTARPSCDARPFRRLLLLWAAVAVSGAMSATAQDTPAVPSTEPVVAKGESLPTKQEALTLRYQRFETTLLQLAEYLRKTDPDRAELLVRALGRSKETRIPDQLAQLVELLKRDQLGDAIDGQETLVTQMQDLLTLLQSEDRQSDIDKERARIAGLIKNVDRLIGKQTDVRSATERGLPGKEVQPQQQNVSEETQKLIDKIAAQDAEKKTQQSSGQSRSGQPKPKTPDGKEDPSKDDPKSDKPPMDKPGSESPDGKGSPQPGKQGEPKPSGKDDKPSKSQPKPSEEPSKDDETPPKNDDPKKPEGNAPKSDGQSPPKPGKPSKSQPSPSSPPMPMDGETPPMPNDGDQDSQPSPPQEQSESPRELPQTPGRKELEQARRDMERAIEELKGQQRDKASGAQDQALADLLKAKEKLEEILRQLREEEKELMLAAMEARFRDMLGREIAVLNGTVGLAAVPEDQRSDRHRSRGIELARQQDEVAILAAKALTLLKEEGSSIAFPEAVEQIRGDMLTSARRLERVDVGEITQGIQRDIVESLEEILDALQKELEKSKDQRKKQQPPQQGKPQQPGLVDSLAELKMLRSLQYRVNRRTRELGRLTDGEQSRDQDVLGQLQELSRRQAKIQRTAADLAAGRNQ